MSNLKLIILMMNAVLRVVAQQWYMYELVKTFGFTVSNCTEQKVDSILSCAAIGRVAKAPTYVFIVDKNLCLWDCKSFKNDYPSVENHKWRQYGKLTQFNFFPLNQNLLITSIIGFLVISIKLLMI